MAKKKKFKTKTKSDQTEKLTKKTLIPTKSTRSTTDTLLDKSTVSDTELVFNKDNYKWVLIGIALITIGMFLMMGGFNENPTTWDEGEIYSFRRTLLAPIVILAGLGVEIYAIFK